VTKDDRSQREFGGPQAFPVELRNRQCPAVAADTSPMGFFAQNSPPTLKKKPGSVAP